jgi:hypothetical protein
MSGIYGVLDQAIAFEKKLQKDELNLENESSPTFERSKFAISFLIIALLLDLVIFFLVL